MTAIQRGCVAVMFYVCEQLHLSDDFDQCVCVCVCLCVARVGCLFVYEVMVGVMSCPSLADVATNILPV